MLLVNVQHGRIIFDETVKKHMGKGEVDEKLITFELFLTVAHFDSTETTPTFTQIS